MNEFHIEVGRTYRFRNSKGEITESTVIAIGEPKPWMVRFRKPDGEEYDVSIKTFIHAWKMYGVKEEEKAV